MLTHPLRYGLIACRYFVAGWHNKVWITAPEVAEYYNMNVRALNPALQRLVRAGILRSRRGGNNPGFMLSRNPSEINMLEVMKALGGEMHIDCCKTVMPELKCTCRAEYCLICGTLRDTLNSMRAKLTDMSLERHAELK